MKLFYTLYVWLVAMIQKLTGGLPAETEENALKPLKLDLQFFADDDDSDDDDSDADDSDDLEDEDSGDDDDSPSLDELLKDKEFKKQYNKRLKEQLGKRMKKYDGVDPKEYKRLKAAADKKKGKDVDPDDGPDPEQQKRLLRAERREKKAVIKEFAVDNGHNAKLLTRLIDVDAIELDEDGEPENLDELFEELESDFPEYFGTSDEDDEEEPVKKKKFVPGSKQKSNKSKEPDPAALAKADIERRHGKKKEE